MNDAKSFLIGSFGLAVAVLTVVAFVASMLYRSLAEAAVANGASAEPRPRGTSTLRRVAALRWPLAVLMLLITAYRIYSLS